jgi:voltage-gated potassium channel
MDVLKILRLFKVFRIFRIFRHMPIIVGFMKAMKDYKDEYKSVGFLMITTMIVVSVFVYYAESEIPNSNFINIPITLRWALVTMTTV